MTVHDSRNPVTTTAIPRPRAPQDDTVEPDMPDQQVAERPHADQPSTVGEFPWPEPWHFSRGARPRSEYWDEATAGWHSRGPICRPRQGG
jgi:hypothetical protein